MKALVHSACLIFLTYFSYAEPVVLKAADGRTITATVTGVQNGEVLITKQDGQTYRFPLAGLDDASKATVIAENAKIAAGENAAKIRELDARILATRKQIIQLLDQAANTRGSFETLPEMQAVMEVTNQRVKLLRNNLNLLLALRNDLTGRQNEEERAPAPLPRPAPNIGGGSGYYTTIEENDNGTLSLNNKAIVEISNTFIGFIGSKKKCLLFKDVNGFKIWIEGKKTFKCDLLQAPENARAVGLTSVTINEVLRDGKFLKLSDGRILRVGDFDAFNTSMLMGPTDGLLLETGELVILDEGTTVSVEVIE